MAEPKQSKQPTLELRKNKERLNRLNQVKERAKLRTNQRIQMIQDDLALKEAEKAGK